MFEKWRQFRLMRKPKFTPEYKFLGVVQREARLARNIQYSAACDFSSIMLDADTIRTGGRNLSDAAIGQMMENAASSVLRARTIARIAARKASRNF